MLNIGLSKYATCRKPKEPRLGRHNPYLKNPKNIAKAVSKLHKIYFTNKKLRSMQPTNNKSFMSRSCQTSFKSDTESLESVEVVDVAKNVVVVSTDSDVFS